MTEAIVTVAPKRIKPGELLLHALPALLALAAITSWLAHSNLAIAAIVGGLLGAIAGPRGCLIGAWTPIAGWLIWGLL